MREIVVKTAKEVEVPFEALRELRRVAFQQWVEAGLYTSVVYSTTESFSRYLIDKMVFVAQDTSKGNRGRFL